MYYAVQLNSDIFNEKMVVPSIWLDKYDTLCLLPPTTDVAEIETLAKTQSTPKHGWQLHSVSFIQSFDTYSQAKESIAKGKSITINLEKDGEKQHHREMRRKRKRKLPQFLEQYSIESNDNEEESGNSTLDECSMEDNIVPDPLIIKIEAMEDSNAPETHQQPRLSSTHNRSSSSVHSSLQHGSHFQVGESSSSTIRLGLGKTTSLCSGFVIDEKCSNCNELEKRIRTMEQEIVSIKKILMDGNEATTKTSVDKMKHQNSQKFKDFQQLRTTEDLAAFNRKLKDNEVLLRMDNFETRSDADMQTQILKAVLKNTNVLKEQSKIINTIMSTLNRIFERLPSESNVQNDEISLPVNLPLTNLDDLVLLEKALEAQNLQEYLCEKIYQVGGKNLGNVIRRMLKRLMTNELATSFSWLGITGKESFADLKITSILFSAVRRNPSFNDCTNDDIETVIKDWLRHAKARCKK